jgi:hypothetical protein
MTEDKGNDNNTVKTGDERELGFLRNLNSDWLEYGELE